MATETVQPSSKAKEALTPKINNSVLGFFAKKKATIPVSLITDPPPITPVTVHPVTEGLCSPSPRALNENFENQGLDPVRISSPTHQVVLQKSEEILAPVPSKLADFKKTLQDLDREIHGFEKVTEGHLGSNDYIPALD